MVVCCVQGWAPSQSWIADFQIPHTALQDIKIGREGVVMLCRYHIQHFTSVQGDCVAYYTCSMRCIKCLLPTV